MYVHTYIRSYIYSLSLPGASVPRLYPVDTRREARIPAASIGGVSVLPPVTTLLTHNSGSVGVAAAGSWQLQGRAGSWAAVVEGAEALGRQVTSGRGTWLSHFYNGVQ